MSAGVPFKINEWNVTRRDCKRDGVRGLQISAALAGPSANPSPPSEKVISIKSAIIEVFISIFGFGWLENQIKTKNFFPFLLRISRDLPWPKKPEEFSLCNVETGARLEMDYQGLLTLSLKFFVQKLIKVGRPFQWFLKT